MTRNPPPPNTSANTYYYCCSSDNDIQQILPILPSAFIGDADKPSNSPITLLDIVRLLHTLIRFVVLARFLARTTY